MLFLFDLDGTICQGGTLAEGALELIDALHRLEVAFCFVTNASLRTRDEVIAKLCGMGVPATRDNTYTSAASTAEYLVLEGVERVAVIGSQGLRDELLLRGITIDEAKPQALVVGLDPEFKTPPSFIASLSCPIVACNVDMDYPSGGGERKPGCGVVVRAIEESTGQKAKVIGKPGTFMLDSVCADFGVDPSEVLVIGDSHQSDIAMADAGGCPSVLVGEQVDLTDVREAVEVASST